MTTEFKFVIALFLSVFVVEAFCAGVAENENCEKSDFLQNSTFCCRASDVRDDVRVHKDGSFT